MNPIEVTKKQLKDPCFGCGAHLNGPLCCNYIQFEIPRYSEDETRICFDTLHWYLTRPDIKIEMFKEEGKPTEKAEFWRVYLMQRCRFLKNDGRCGNYEKRPLVCSEYSAFPSINDAEAEGGPTFCEKYDPEPEDKISFSDPDEFISKMKEWFGFDPAVLREELEYDMNYLKVTDDDSGV